MNTYSEILKVWNDQTPDDFAIFSELYYEMFGGEEEIPYTTSSTCSSFFPYNWFIMNYTLKQLQERVNKLIEQQGEDAYCAAWIYTAEDCVIRDEDGEDVDYPAHNDRELSERIFNDVGNIDYIYQVIQECVDEVTEEQYMAYQQELTEV